MVASVAGRSRERSRVRRRTPQSACLGALHDPEVAQLLMGVHDSRRLMLSLFTLHVIHGGGDDDVVETR